jgi:hypothetical protein
MERRSALKNMAMMVGGLVALPDWANGWSKNTIVPNTLLSANASGLLTEIVETIIPATDTPGAKALGIDQFIQKVIADCYSKTVQDNFAKGLASIEATASKSFSKPFASLTTPQRIELLKGYETSTDHDKKEFYGLVKGLTIRGYLNSEYVMTNITHYEMVPGHFYGCVPVKG